MTPRTSGAAIALALACLPILPLAAQGPLPSPQQEAATQAPTPSATPSKTLNAPGAVGLEEFGRLLGYLTLFAALAAVAVYFAKYGLPFAKKTNRGERKLQILEMRPLGNRQFLLVVAYEETRILLGVTPGKIDYLCPLDTPEAPARDFSALLKTEKSPGTAP
jgi:flagellar biogenesis protein FliO